MYIFNLVPSVHMMLSGRGSSFDLWLLHMNYIHNIATFLVNLKIRDYFANFQVRAMKKLVEEGKVKH